MRRAVPSDESLVVSIISETFINNPSVNSVVKNDGKKTVRLKTLAKYVFRTAVQREGVFISNDNNGMAVCYPYNYKKETIKDYWYQLILVLKCIGISRVIKVLKREAYIKKYRPQNGEFLYFWFFGVTKNGSRNGAAIELKNAIFNESTAVKLPVYLETSVERNKIIYERYGFEVYHTWKNENDNMTLWFMRRTLVL